MDALRELWRFMTTEDNWWGGNGITQRLTDHVWISVVSVVIAALLALPPAMALGHIRRGGLIAATVVNIGRSIPTFAIVSLLFPISLSLGFTENLGFWPTTVALVLLAIPPMFTNAYTGIVGVEAPVVDASRGMGLRPAEVLWGVELPNALPLVITGVRVAAVQVVATATLGAYVGFGGLGAFINEGFSQNDDGKLLTGAVLVALLAIGVELGFGVVERVLTPWARTTSPRGRWSRWQRADIIPEYELVESPASERTDA
ncbi:MAG: ABC transporter permease [Acidimicrobiales bacterium]